MTEAAARDALHVLLGELTGRLDVATLPPETGLLGRGLALDSRRAAAMLAAVHDRFGVDVAALDLALDCLDSIGALATFIATHAA